MNSPGISSATLPRPAAEPEARVGPIFVLFYGLALFGLWMAVLTPVIVSMALRIATLDPVNKATILSEVMGMGALVALFANPICGYFSDRTTSRLGMRRPWILGGTLVGMLGLYLVATGNLTTIMIGWLLAQAGYNAVLAAVIALLPDQVPESQRGRVSGVLGVCLPLGVLAGVTLTKYSGGVVFNMFMWPAALAALFAVLLCLLLKDRRLDPSKAAAVDLAGFSRTFLINPRKAPDFSWAFVSRLLLFIGLAMLKTYQVFFLIDKLHVLRSDIPSHMLTATLVLTGTTVIGSFLGGTLSDRFQARKPFVLGAALIFGIGLWICGLSNDFNQFLIGLAVGGFGEGIYLAVDMALVTAVLPNRETDAAKDLGIFNIASALPQSLAPAIAPFFLAIGSAGGAANNYTALFIAAGCFSALGAVAVMFIRGVR
ncbi:MAG: MFS transporter [Burkholderiales bacterium]|nr:MFS transporter [Burkholderiales bacterium]